MKLQAVIGGYRGSVAVVFGDIDIETETLFIVQASKAKPKMPRFDDETGLISNQPLDDMDFVFSEQDFSQALKDYRYYANSGRLVFDEKVKRATPRIEVEKITESGPQLAIYGDITNEELAVIALCFFAKKVSEAQKTLDIYQLDGTENDFITI